MNEHFGHSMKPLSVAMYFKTTYFAKTAKTLAVS